MRYFNVNYFNVTFNFDSDDNVSFNFNLILISDMTCSTSDGFLLRFLRARKFDLERAYLLLVRYLEVREEYPEVFIDFH